MLFLCYYQVIDQTNTERKSSILSMHLYQYIAYIYISHIDIYEYTLAQIEYRYTRRKNHNKKDIKKYIIILERV